MSLPLTAFISPGGGELIVIMLVLIMLFGAKDAPRILRSIQTFLDRMQRTAAEFRYKMMYSDLHRDTTAEEPYDIDADYPEEDEEEQRPDAGEQTSEGDKKTPEEPADNP